MAKNSVSTFPSKLNLNKQQTELFQNIILLGNNMSNALKQLDKDYLLPVEFNKLPNKWGKLMTDLALLLIL
jgi:hypothetical protein